MDASTPGRPKRGDGEGSYYWLASRSRWMCAWTDGDGRRRTKVAIPNTERGAQATLRKVIGPQRPTLAEWMERWLETRRAAGRSERTIEVYRERLVRHVLPSLGHVRLDRISAEAIERLYAQKLREGLSPTTLVNLHNNLHALLRTAKRRRQVAVVVTAGIVPPRGTTYEARSLTLDEACRLLVAVRGHRYGPFWTFMLGTGCRYGEATGLMWRYVDLGAATALICQQAIMGRDPAKVNSRGEATMRRVMSPLTTEAARREVQLPAFVVAALRIQQQMVESLRGRSTWRPGIPDLVFPSVTGDVLSNSSVRAAWHEELQRLGLEGQLGQRRLRMLDLCHTLRALRVDAEEGDAERVRALDDAWRQG